MFKRLKTLFSFEGKPIIPVTQHDRYRVTFINNDGVHLLETELNEIEVKELRRRIISGSFPFWISPSVNELFLVGCHITQIYIHKIKNKNSKKTDI